MLQSIRSSWHDLGVQRKLHIIIQSMLIILCVVAINWVISRFERQIFNHAEQRAQDTADGLINGMNMLMLTGTISDTANRKLLLNKMSQSDGIKELRIVRGKWVIAQFGPGLPEEQAQDDMDRAVLDSGTVMIKRIDTPGQPPALRVMVPFIAQKNFRGTNCFQCHTVPDYSVNGAASVVIDLSKDYAGLAALKKNLWMGYIPIQIVLSLLSWLLVRHLIMRNIAKPARALQATMSEIQHNNDLSKRAAVDEQNPDIGDMARSFNALLDTLEHANERLQLFAKMFENSSEGIIITDADKLIIAVNPSFEQITQYRSDEVVGKNPRLLSSGKQSEDFYKTMWESINVTGKWSGEIWNKRKNGEVYPEWMSIGAVRNHKDEIINYISLFSDITQRKEAELRIEFLAHYDSLTRLPNRVLFADRLNHALLVADRTESKVALMFLDLDKFKSINDTLGHLAGDQLLQSVAERLKLCMRVSDTVCRQSGDEFIILLEDVGSVADVELVARNILVEMSAPHRMGEVERIVSCSIGAALFPDDANDDESLMQRADQAMYQAKRSGRNNFKMYERK